MRVADFVFEFISVKESSMCFSCLAAGRCTSTTACASRGRLHPISMLHEQGAAIAAEGYARTSGKFGVCLVTSGPGATNAMTGLAGAWFESTPVLYISGQAKRADLKGTSGVRQLGPQELDIVPVVRSIAKYAVCLTEPLDVRYELEKAVYLMQDGRPGPVWIEIPLDVQATEIDPKSLRGFDPPDVCAEG